MSKHFELLQKAGKEKAFDFSPEPAPASPKVSAPIRFRKFPPDTEITKLVQRLFSQTIKGGGPRVVSFSGVARGDRTSWICSRAGEALAEQSDASVCLVEANLFSPQLHLQFGAPNRTGMADSLTSKGSIREFAIPVFAENLWLIPAGSVRPGFYASVDRYRERFAELREAFDYVLVSASPLSDETEATRMGQLADGIVLIIEANHTRREMVRRAKEQLESARVKLLGAVLDQRTFPIPEQVYKRL